MRISILSIVRFSHTILMRTDQCDVDYKVYDEITENTEYQLQKSCHDRQEEDSSLLIDVQNSFEQTLSMLNFSGSGNKTELILSTGYSEEE